MGRVGDRNEIRVGDHPQRIVGECPLLNVLQMAKPDSKRIQTFLKKAIFWWEQIVVAVGRRG